MVGREIKGFLKTLEESEVPGVISATEARERAKAGTGGAGVLAIRPPCSRQHLLSIASRIIRRQEGDFSTNHSVLQDYLLRGPADAHLSQAPSAIDQCVTHTVCWMTWLGDRSLLCWSARMHAQPGTHAAAASSPKVLL
jgi:hypothetical protein